MHVLGVDGCRAGWFAFRLTGRGAGFDVFVSFEDLWARWGRGSSLCLVDVPIGLADTEAARACDVLARRLLGRRASSVFNPPVRPALDSKTWSEAARQNEARTGKRITLQAWHIVPRIREVDRFLRMRGDARRKVREAHPEVLFHVLNGQVALTQRKSCAAGVDERLDILGRYYSGAREVASRALGRYPTRDVQADDVVDALVLAVVARCGRGRLGTLPKKPGRDAHGLPMEMVVPAPA